MLQPEIYIVGLLAGLLTIFINYCIGKPGSKDFSPYEIFSGYTIYLSKRRLKQVGLWPQYSEQYHENLKRHESKAGTIIFQNEFKKVIYEAAEPFFTWERAAGMCPVCSGVWVSLFAGIVFTKNVLYLITIIVISHVVIRLLNKII